MDASGFERMLGQAAGRGGGSGAEVTIPDKLVYLLPSLHELRLTSSVQWRNYSHFIPGFIEGEQ